VGRRGGSPSLSRYSKSNNNQQNSTVNITIRFGHLHVFYEELVGFRRTGIFLWRNLFTMYTQNTFDFLWHVTTTKAAKDWASCTYYCIVEFVLPPQDVSHNGDLLLLFAPPNRTGNLWITRADGLWCRSEFILRAKIFSDIIERFIFYFFFN